MISVPDIFPLTAYTFVQQRPATDASGRLADAVRRGARDLLSATQLFNASIEIAQTQVEAKPKQIWTWAKKGLETQATQQQLPAIALWNAAAAISRDKTQDFSARLRKVVVVLRQAAELLAKQDPKSALCVEYVYIYNVFSAIQSELELVNFFKLQLGQEDAADEGVTLLREGEMEPDLSQINISWALEFTSFVSKFYEALVAQSSIPKIYQQLTNLLKEKNAFYRFFSRYLIAVTNMSRSLSYQLVLARDIRHHYEEHQLKPNQILQKFCELTMSKSRQQPREDASPSVHVDYLDVETYRIFSQTSSFQREQIDVRPILQLQLPSSGPSIVLFVDSSTAVVRQSSFLHFVDLAKAELTKTLEMQQEYRGQYCGLCAQQFVEHSKGAFVHVVEIASGRTQLEQLPRELKPLAFCSVGNCIYFSEEDTMLRIDCQTLALEEVCAFPTARQMDCLSETELVAIMENQAVALNVQTLQTRALYEFFAAKHEQNDLSLGDQFFASQNSYAAARPARRDGLMCTVDSCGLLEIVNTASFQSGAEQFSKQGRAKRRQLDSPKQDHNAPDVQRLMQQAKSCKKISAQALSGVALRMKRAVQKETEEHVASLGVQTELPSVANDDDVTVARLAQKAAELRLIELKKEHEQQVTAAKELAQTVQQLRLEMQHLAVKLDEARDDNK